LTVSQYTGVTRRRDRSSGGNELLTDASSLVGYRIVEEGNLVVNIMLAWNGSVGVSPFAGITSPAYAVFRFSSAANPRFFHYLYRTSVFTGVFKTVSTGVVDSRLRLYPEVFLRLQSLLPPFEEQTASARFLDFADRQISRYIRAKQKLIKLLEEQKQAIIHRAVTRGLDPNVRLKPSGVEWLGDVPEHWGVTQMRSVAHIVRGGSPRPAGSPLYFHGNALPWITVGEITKDRGMHLIETSTRLTAEGSAHSRTIEAGTLLLTNSGATLGVPKISLIRGCINDGVAALLRLRPDINKEFLYYYWCTQTSQLRAWVDLGAQPNLNTQIIGGWPLLLPMRLEQDRIVTYTIREIQAVDTAIEKPIQEIALLREYRTRLITDVVTGKLDVREAAAHLPDEADPLLEDSIDEIAETDLDELETAVEEEVEA
jgi:type I restriction enzyme S subunit